LRSLEDVVVDDDDDDNEVWLRSYKGNIMLLLLLVDSAQVPTPDDSRPTNWLDLAVAVVLLFWLSPKATGDVDDNFFIWRSSLVVVVVVVGVTYLILWLVVVAVTPTGLVLLPLLLRLLPLLVAEYAEGRWATTAATAAADEDKDEFVEAEDDEDMDKDELPTAVVVAAAAAVLTDGWDFFLLLLLGFIVSPLPEDDEDDAEAADFKVVDDWLLPQLVTFGPQPAKCWLRLIELLGDIKARSSLSNMTTAESERRQSKTQKYK
jgi:hypothetical protein